MKMTKPLARAITGGLGSPSKMPGYSWGIPASTCQLGSLLAKKPGTVCSKCYALRGFYRLQSTQDRLQAALDLFDIAAETAEGLERWCQAMAWLIIDSGDDYFRWFHSGDSQSAKMCRAIYRVCDLTPRVKHWAPSREKDHWKAAGPPPRNLALRFSGTMIDGPPPQWGPRLASTVSTGERLHGRRCPAHMQANACGDCRACWDKRITVIEYETNNVH